MMDDKESFERVVHGLKKAASRARELGTTEKSMHWNNVSAGLEGLLKKSIALYSSKEIKRQDALDMLDKRVGKKVDKENNTIN